jgi:hypothetical protein
VNPAGTLEGQNSSLAQEEGTNHVRRCKERVEANNFGCDWVLYYMTTVGGSVFILCLLNYCGKMMKMIKTISCSLINIKTKET